MGQNEQVSTQIFSESRLRLTRRTFKAYPVGNGTLNCEPFESTEPFDMLLSNQYPSSARLPTPDIFELLAENSPGHSPTCPSSTMGFSATEMSHPFNSASRQKFPDLQSALDTICPPLNPILDSFLYASPTATFEPSASSVAVSSWYARSPSLFKLRDGGGAVFTHELRVESSPSASVGVVGSGSRAEFNENGVVVVENEHGEVNRRPTHGVEAARMEVGSSNQDASGRGATCMSWFSSLFPALLSLPPAV